MMNKTAEKPRFGELRVFDEIYQTHFWGNGSGSGSSPDATLPYREFLTRYLRDNRIRSVVDLGCGDWQFSRLIDWSGIRYHGFDAAKRVVLSNLEEFSNENVTFSVMESYEAIPTAELLIIKDVLQHLSNQEINRIVQELIPRFDRTLVTNCVPPIRSFFHLSSMFNQDILTGDFRFVDLRRPPFNCEAEMLLEWEINHRNLKDTFKAPWFCRRPDEALLKRTVKYPLRVAKSLALGINCDYRKHTMLIRNRV